MNFDLFVLHVDDKIFCLTRKTIEKYPDSLLCRVINGDCTDDIVIKSGNDIYIDRDPKSFAYVVDYLRNYDVIYDKISDEYLKSKVIDDLDYFGLYCNYSGNNFESIGGANVISDVDICNKTLEHLRTYGCLSGDEVQFAAYTINNLSNDENFKKLMKQQQSAVVDGDGDDTTSSDYVDFDGTDDTSDNYERI